MAALGQYLFLPLPRAEHNPSDWLPKIMDRSFKRRAVLRIIVLSAASLSGITAIAAERIRRVLRPVGAGEISISVFFPKEFDKPDETPSDYPFNLSPLERTVKKATVAEDSVRQLLANPTAAEVETGFYPLDVGGLSLESLEILPNRTARVTFTAADGEKTWAGDITRRIFKAALKYTLTQFYNVDDVLICITL